MEPTKKKKIIIVLILILIVGIVIFMLTRKTTTTNTGTNGTKTGVDLGQLDPTKQGKNPDGTDIISGTLPGTGSTTNNDGTYTNYTGINTNGVGGTGQNTGGNNGTGGGIGGNGGGGNGGGGGLIDLSGGNGNGGGNGGGGGNATSDPCTKAPSDMTTAERDLCIGPAGGATQTEDNTLILTDAQRRQLDDLDRTFYRTAPALANPDILADYIDEVKGYDATHNKLKTNINQCLALIDDDPRDYDGFQFRASYLGIDGRTWYRANPKLGYTPGYSRVAGNIPVGKPVTWRPKDLSISADPIYQTGAYYYLKYYGETSYAFGVPSIDAFSRSGGALDANGKPFKTALEIKINAKDPNWFDRGTFLRTNTNVGNGKEDAENLRQFEELFEIY